MLSPLRNKSILFLQWHTPFKKQTKQNKKRNLLWRLPPKLLTFYLLPTAGTLTKMEGKGWEKTEGEKGSSNKEHHNDFSPST